MLVTGHHVFKLAFHGSALPSVRQSILRMSVHTWFTFYSLSIYQWDHQNLAYAWANFNNLAQSSVVALVDAILS